MSEDALFATSVRFALTGALWAGFFLPMIARSRMQLVAGIVAAIVAVLAATMWMGRFATSSDREFPTVMMPIAGVGAMIGIATQSAVLARRRAGRQGDVPGLRWLGIGTAVCITACFYALV